MGHRYRSVLSAMPYALIHMTGDFPIYAYRTSSQLILFLGFAVGMSAMASSSGIFAAAYVSVVTEDKSIVLAEREKDRSVKLLRVALRLQLLWRKRRRRRQLGLLDAPQARQGAHWPTQLRMITDRSTPLGVIVMNFINLLIFLDVCNSIAWTIPEVKELRGISVLHRVLAIFCDIVFVVEYVVMILSRFPSCFKYAVTPARLIDFICCVPGIFRISKYLQYFESNLITSIEVGVWQVPLDIALTMRSVRILQFPYFRHQAHQVFIHGMDTAEYLALPALTALFVWLQISAYFMWTENYFNGPAQFEMSSLINAMFYTSSFIVGEWPMADFAPATAVYGVSFTVLFAVMVFGIPFGLMVESASSAFLHCNQEESGLTSQTVRWKGEDAEGNIATA